MAIEKMVLIKIVASLNDMHNILKQIILSESAHFDFEESNTYDDYYMLHEYEAFALESSYYKDVDSNEMLKKCTELEAAIEKLCQTAGIKLNADKKNIEKYKYSFDSLSESFKKINEEMANTLENISLKKEKVALLSEFEKKIGSIDEKDLDFRKLSDLNYFDYEIGTLSNEDNIRMKRNYENISAIALKIGIIKSSVEDMYIVIYPKKLKDENINLLKSLNWNKVHTPEGINGTVEEMLLQTKEQIIISSEELENCLKSIEKNIKENEILLNKIYTAVKLEKKIYELEKNINYQEHVFVVNAWTRDRDKDFIKESLEAVTEKFMMTYKKPEEISKNVMPPTILKNNFFSKPFETIVKMYGLPSYHEIDPTPFLSITFFMMFGMMFGDIGQGLVYLLAGILIAKKSKAIGDIAIRVGISSIMFGFVYGSLFGLEKEELPWLPSLIGKPLDPKNIMPILLTGVVFGIVVLSVSYFIGILNRLKKKDIEEGIFGKNGLMGYIFFMSFVLIAVAITKIINIPIQIPVATLIISLLIMILKQPIAHLIIGKRPLVHGGIGAYLTESIFEAIETILGTLSNAISFMRVGAFALSHAGLSLAFIVMSNMSSNIIVRIFILLLGNILILSLEGLVVLIQCLRLEYYEMFSKYFVGDGLEYKPVKINE
jgi:V/A-type H+-transporting ATPase subunit I